MKNRKLVIYAMATLLIAIAVNNIVLTEPSPPGVIPFPPTVTTNLATNVTHNSATLNGTVNPNGFDTMTYFEWSETIPYGNSTPFQFIGSGVVNVDVMAGISGLSANTTYNYRIVASNLGGTSYGLNQAFTTLLPPLPEQVTSPEPMNGAINVIITPILSWAIASGATSYDVYFGTTPALLFVTNTTETNYNPGTLNYNTTYYWRIDSRNAYGTTTGNLWSFTTQMSPPVPIAPSNLIATAVSHNQIDLVWQDNSDNEDAFNIERRTLDTPYSRVATLPANSTTYSDTGLEPSTTYFYCVNASNVAGNSPYSNETVTTTLPPPIIPIAPSYSETLVYSPSEIVLFWDDNSDNELGFKIERSLDGMVFTEIATTDADSNYYYDSGLTSNTCYYYRVRAYNAWGFSDYSNVADGTTMITISDLGNRITELRNSNIITHGMYVSFMAKVNAALASYERGNYNTACNQLRALYNEIKASLDRFTPRAEGEKLLSDTDRATESPKITDARIKAKADILKERDKLIEEVKQDEDLNEDEKKARIKKIEDIYTEGHAALQIPPYAHSVQAIGVIKTWTDRRMFQARNGTDVIPADWPCFATAEGGIDTELGIISVPKNEWGPTKKGHVTINCFAQGPSGTNVTITTVKKTDSTQGDKDRKIPPLTYPEEGPDKADEPNIVSREITVATSNGEVSDLIYIEVEVTGVKGGETTTTFGIKLLIHLGPWLTPNK